MLWNWPKAWPSRKAWRWKDCARFTEGWMKTCSGSRPGPFKSWTGTAPTNSAAAAATPTVQRETERSKECPKCGQIHFPRLAPAVIVLVERGNQILMARSRHFAPGMFSVLAGFVEPGETLEEAVAREVKEESGILVKDIRYFGSQPWPFPHSLMIGFTAKYAGGEITLEDSELEEAGWYTADNLPPQPGKISIARKLIDAFVEKQKQKP